MDASLILPTVAGVCSAVLVAILNNWDKLNKNKKTICEMRETLDKLRGPVEDTRTDIKAVFKKLTNLSSAQRTLLQTQILEKCKRIQDKIALGDSTGIYDEDLKQLIILYREYHQCGFNSQGKLYFNDTIQKAAESNSARVHELMNLYFAEYEPSDKEE